MKIRKKEEKPMVIHTKKAPKIRIRRGKEKTEGTQVKKKANASVKMRHKRLRVVAGSAVRAGVKTGVRTGARQMEGSEEIQDAVSVATTVSLPVKETANKAIRQYKRKLQEQKKERRKHSRLRSEKEHAEISMKMRRSKHSATKGKGEKTPFAGRGKDKKGGVAASFVKERMLETFLGKLQSEQDVGQGQFVEGVTNTAKAAALMIVKKVVALLAPLLLGLFLLVATVGAIVVAVLAVIYNSPLSVFFPQPETGYDSPRTVLSQYYKEFNEEICALEDKGYDIVYQNAENGAPVSNYNDTLMVYMVLYGTGQAGYVMDDEGKENLKEVFDAMNYYDTSSDTKKIKAGECIGTVVTTGYCDCSICCGKWAGGKTASGTKPKADHTLAVDAKSPKVPMETKIVMNGKTYKVEDTGDFAKYGTDFDIYFSSHADALAWGKRKLKAYLAEGDKNTVKVTLSGTTVHNLTYEDYIALGKLDEDQVQLLKEMMESDYWEAYYSAGGGATVAELAMTKIGCGYSNDRRYAEGWYDCSSLVQRLYQTVGIELPGTAAAQGEYCYKNAMIINKKELKPGDLIFYSYKENGRFRNISHVAIYVGDGNMVHAANEKRGVVLDPLSTNKVVFYARPY